MCLCPKRGHATAKTNFSLCKIKYRQNQNQNQDSSRTPPFSLSSSSSSSSSRTCDQIKKQKQKAMVLPSIIHQDHFLDQSLYGVKINGSIVNVTVTYSPAIVYNWIYTTLFLHNEILFNKRLIVGLGVQWSPYSSRKHYPPADILNLCVGRRCLFFQLSYATAAPQILYDFLMNPRHTFVGLWNKSDRWRLDNSIHRLRMFAAPLDLKQVVLNSSHLGEIHSCYSTNRLVWMTLEFRVNQTVEIGKSCWDELFLSNEQILFACVDVHCAFLIGRKFSAWNHNRYRNY